MLESLLQAYWYAWQTWQDPRFVPLVRDVFRERRMTPAQHRQLTEQRLRRILVLAGDEVPYYRAQFDSVGFDPETARLPEDLPRLPVLTKDDLRRHQDAMLRPSVPLDRRVKNATGGSTGEPVTFWQEMSRDRLVLALDTYVRSWWRVSPHARYAAIWGADRDFRDLSLRDRFYQWRQRYRALNAFRMTEEEMDQFARLLQRWRPSYLVGYASALRRFAQFVQDRRLGGLRFVAIRSAAEMLYPNDRQVIQEALGGPVYDFYGSREVCSLAAECQLGRMHLISSWRHVELTDEHGAPVPPGQPGYVTVTSCSNDVMPLVRYRNGDMAVWSREPCDCGLPTPVIERLLGRSSDLIRTPDGRWIHGEFFTHLFYGRDDIERFQVVQPSLDRLVIRFVPRAPTADAFVASLVPRIRREMGPGVEIESELCTEIPVTASGKYRFTVSEIDSDSGSA